MSILIAIFILNTFHLKRLYTSEEFKRLNQARAIRNEQRRLRGKEKRKLRNRRKIGKKKNKFRRARPAYSNQDRTKFTTIIAPGHFSLIQNTNEVLKFIAKLKYCYDARKPVHVSLQEITEISYDAIVVLLSILIKFKTNGIKFNGRLPSDVSVKKILLESEFFKYLNQPIQDEERYHLGEHSSIHTHAWKDVDSVLGDSIIRGATRTVWNETRRCQGIQRTLIELMLNTNNHADDSRQGEKHWWLSVHHDKLNRKVSFAFIDFGVGVFTSLNNKREGSKFYKILEKIKESYSFGANADLLKLILDGTLHRTATGKPYHGKGLPSIYRALERNQLSNLNIITNDVHANVSLNKFEALESVFSGTFVYWELNQENHSCNDSNEDN